MRCNHCNVNISCKTTVCPLCHTPLESANVAEDKQPTLAYPKRTKHRALSTPLLDKIYLIVALNAIIISLIVNFIVTPDIWWSLVVIAGLVYIYFFIRATILDYKYFSQKVLGQAIVLTILFGAVQLMTRNEMWVCEFVLPAIYFISSLSIGIYILTRIKTARTYIIGLMVTALLGFIPLIINLSLKTETLWPSITTAATSFAIIFTSIVCAYKQIWTEIKKIFHN